MKKVLSALFVLALCSTAAMADVPSPERCSVDPADALSGVVLAPDTPGVIPISVYNVVVRNVDNLPIENALVEFVFGPGIQFCTTADNDGVTNAAGEVTITLRGGGCLDEVGGAVAVLANGIEIRTYNNVKSPDFDGVGPDGAVGLPDLIAFRTPPASCHDYNNDGTVALSDLIIFVSAYKPPHSCTLQ